MDVLAEGRPAVIIIVWYNIPAASDPKTTIITGEIAPDDRGKYGFDGTQGVFSDVKIIESFVSRAT
jgi:hypothetical protein